MVTPVMNGGVIVNSDEGVQPPRKKKPKVGQVYIHPEGWFPDHWQVFLWVGPWAKESTEGCLSPRCGIFDCIHMLDLQDLHLVGLHINVFKSLRT